MCTSTTLSNCTLPHTNQSSAALCEPWVREVVGDTRGAHSRANLWSHPFACLCRVIVASIDVLLLVAAVAMATALEGQWKTIDGNALLATGVLATYEVSWHFGDDWRKRVECGRVILN